MAVITNYATLLTAVADYCARDDLTSYIPNFVQNAEEKLHRILNLREEETALSLNVSSGVAAVPSDFKALKFAYYNTTPSALLRWVSIEELYNDYANRTEITTPSVISREGSNFVFGPVATDGTAVLKGIYYKKLDPVRTTDSTFYVTTGADALLYGSLLDAAMFIQDVEMYARWRPLYDEAVDSIRQKTDYSEYSQGSLVQRVS